MNDRNVKLIGARRHVAKRVVVTALVAVLSTPMASYAHSLSQAIHLALQNNPEIKSAYHGVGIADEQLGQAVAGWLPTLDVSLDSGREYRDKPTSDSTKMMKKSTTVTLTQPLFDGGAAAAAVDRSGQMLEVSTVQLDEIRISVALQTIESWYEIYRLQRVIRWTVENVNQHNKLFMQIQEKVEAGGAGKSELVAAETPLLAAQSALISARGEYRDALARYTKVVGLAPSEVLNKAMDVPDWGVPAEYTQAIEVLLVNNPILKSARANLNAIKADFEGTRAGLLPTLDFELKGGRDLNNGGNEGQEDYYTALLKMKYNLFRGGADQSRRREMANSVVYRQEQFNIARHSMEEQLKLYWNGLEVTRELLMTSKKQYQIAHENAQSVQEQFKLGEADVMTIMAADDALLQAKLAVLQDDTSVRLGVYRVIAHLGVLLNYLDIPEEILNSFETEEDAGDLVFIDRVLAAPGKVADTIMGIGSSVETAIVTDGGGAGPEFGTVVTETVATASEASVSTTSPDLAMTQKTSSWNVAYDQMKDAGWVVLNAVDEARGRKPVVVDSRVVQTEVAMLAPPPVKPTLVLSQGNTQMAPRQKPKERGGQLNRHEQRRLLLASRMNRSSHNGSSYNQKLKNRSQLLSQRKGELGKQLRRFNRKLDKLNLNSSKTGNWIIRSN